jgi:hypothetical protein
MIDTRTRDLTLKVLDGDPRVIGYLRHFQHYAMQQEMLRWLVDARLTGREFIAWAREKKASPMEAARFILGRLAKEAGPKKIELGKDWIR